MKGNEKSLTAYLKASGSARIVASALLAFASAWAFPWMLSMSGDRLEYTNSIVSVFLFLALFCFVNRIFKAGFEGKLSRWGFPLLFGAAFSVCMVFGAQLDLAESIPFKQGRMWVSILVLAILFTLLCRYFWDRLLEWKYAVENRRSQRAQEQEETVKTKSRRSFWITAGVILVLYLPVFLAVYPGFFVYDAQDEYLQVVTRNFSTHHPLMHVLFLGGVIQAVYKLTGSYNLGIACYTLIQMTVMAGIFAWFIEKMKTRGMAKWCRILLALYFGLCPVLVMFSLCSAKDGLFTGMLLIMVVLLQELCADPEVFFRKKRSVLLFAVSSLGMMLLRHNGFYAFLVFALIMIFYTKGLRSKIVVCFGAIIAAYLVINAGLAALLHADDSENQEMLTVPISQMARVYADEKETLSLEEKEILYRYLPEEALARYTPKVSDGVKISFNNEAFAADASGFFKLWAKWGTEHPFTYLNAWFMTSYGFWYPDTVIDVYRGNSVFTFTYEDSSYFGYEVEQPGARESKIPWLDECYRRMSLEIAQQKIPVLSMLFSPGFLFWVTAFGLGFLGYCKCWKKAVPFALPGLVWLTVILGPTYLVRYVVFLWALLPLLIWEVAD